MATRAQQLSAIMTAESGGRNVYNYMYATNPSLYTASGYYQITNSTWKDIAPSAGIDLNQYPTAISAPYDVQTQAANALLDQRGMTPWATSNAGTLVNQIDAGQSPTLVSSPVDSGGAVTSNGGSAIPSGPPTLYQGYGSNGTYLGGTSDPNAYPITGAQSYIPIYPGTSSSTAEAGMPGYLPPAQTGGPAAFGLTTGLAGGISGWLQQLATWVGNAFKNAMGAIFGTATNWALRGILILIGVVLLILALWRLMDPGGETTARLVRTAEVAA